MVVPGAADRGGRPGWDQSRQGPLYVVNLAWLATSSALHASENFAYVLTLPLKLLADTGDPPHRVRSRKRAA